MKKITEEHIEQAMKYVMDNNPPIEESKRKVVLWGCTEGLAYQNLIELFKKEAIEYCGIPSHKDKDNGSPKDNNTETNVESDS